MRSGMIWALAMTCGCSLVSDFGGFHGGDAGATVDSSGIDAGPTCSCTSAAPFCGIAGCRPCVAGEYLDFVDGEIACVPCEPGRFSASLNASSCEAWRDCPVGTYASVRGGPDTDRECTPCPAGTFSADPNQPACTSRRDCPPGTTVVTLGDQTTDRGCEDCPEGETNALSNATACHSALFGRDYDAQRSEGDCLVRHDGTLDCYRGVPNELWSRSFTQVAVSRWGTCAIEETEAAGGQLHCWHSDSLQPFDLDFGSVDAVEVADEHVCARAVGGRYSCANGGPRDANYEDVAITHWGSQGDHGCGVRPDGSLECWGVFFDGESLPAGPFTHVATDSAAFCALHEDNRLECFRVTDGGVESLPSPALPDGRRWVTLEFGCLIDDQGAPFCWEGSTAWSDVPFRVDTAVQPPGAGYRCGVLQGTGGLLCWDEAGQTRWRGIPWIDEV